ncbi:MAG: PIN domain-containing protein [Thermodesulfobacteriota bacterium]
MLSRNLPDNRILECAMAGEADYLISGNHHLTDLKTFDTINIVTPTEFLAFFHQE